MKQYKFLNKINYPDDVKKLSLNELDFLSDEISEFIHDVTQVILSNKFAPYLTSLYSTSNTDISKTYIMGEELNSPLALAAGFDKNCSILKALDKLGFGYIVGGTVTLNPRPGNLKPRITRYVDDNSMVNSLGFPNLGVDKIIDNLSKYDLKTPLIMSISGDSISEITQLYKLLSDYCFGFEINISSPNTEKLKYFHDYYNFQDLIKSLNGIKNKPYMIKFPRLEISDLDQKTILLYEKYFQILLDYKVNLNRPRNQDGKEFISLKRLLSSTTRLKKK